MDPAEALTRIERLGSLDPIVAAARGLVQRALSRQDVRDALHGSTWLGHPLHPMLTDVTIGAFTTATALDFLPRTGPSSGVLMAAGIASAAPTAASGLADWSRLHDQQSRVGLVHAAGNTVALGLYAASLWNRLRKRKLRSRLQSVAGLAALTVSGYVGGHLSYRQAAGVNHGEETPHLFPKGWQRLGRLDEVPEGKPTKRSVAGVDLFVYRRGGDVHVLADRCAHLAGPLSEGSVDGGAEPCVTCPWHGSTFRLADGAVVHGPATAPQSVFRSRIVDGALEVMLPGAG